MKVQDRSSSQRSGAEVLVGDDPGLLASPLRVRRDPGSGIPPGIQGKIFELFCTTKEVGKGSGQGLAIGRAVVVDKHRGQFTFASELGSGTTFYIRLPVDEPAQRAAA
jgi:signal transduction histidine kinase